jgi:hypothetical protein
MADITNIGSYPIKVQWPNPDRKTLPITRPLFGALTPETTEQNRNFSVDVNTGTANGISTIYDITGGNKIKIGTLSVDKDKNANITLEQNIKNTYPKDTVKSLTDKNSNFFKTILNGRNTWIRDSYWKTAENSGQEFFGVDQVDPNIIIPQESIPESQLSGVGDLENTEELPDDLKFLEYPLGYQQYKQDFIEFKILKYVPRVYNVKTLGRLERFKTLDKDGKFKDIREIKATVILPIQGGIVDNNIVNWNADQFNAVKQAASFASLATQQDGVEAIGPQIDALSNIATKASTNAGVEKYLQALFARLATSSDNPFFSRAYGAILNPNLELLFQNPELRSFSLRFDLTPRSRPEAAIVKRIIRVFKQTMAVRQGVADIFLKTPMIYEIKYINGRGKKPEEHTSINKIKTCALRSCSVNYTPNNQYMTYDDDAATMSGYSLELQFVELEPVYYNDYKGLKGDVIGY